MRRIGIAEVDCFDGPCNPNFRPCCNACGDRPMKVYVGNEGRIQALSYLAQMGYGVLITAKYNDPDRFPYYCLDNGAYGAWRSGRKYDPKPFEASLKRFLEHERKPDFAVIPDIVAGGIKSLEHSISWLDKLPKEGQYYLAVQDGMTLDDLDDISLKRIHGLFVGGTLKWKIKTGELWVKYAHSKNIRCHIGRAGTFNRIIWASRINADSIDSMSWARNDSYHILENAQTQSNLAETKVSR